MRFADLVREFQPALKRTYHDRLLPSHRQAMKAILACRTPEAGELILHCPDCGKVELRPKSCGNRNCPLWQNHETSAWLDRQRNKLLPIPYFLVTFTVPATLRTVAFHNPRIFFRCLFEATALALKQLGTNERFLGAETGMTGVLHTHSRSLEFHPHIHFVVPAGGIDRKNRFWKRCNGKFLFPQRALAKIFRAKLIAGLRKNGLVVPEVFRKGDWVVSCKSAGSGEPALKYLSRYLYRGIIAERRIVRCVNGQVTFIYKESRTGTWRERTLPGEDFLWLVLQHALPRGFRRVRDYGFLQGKARNPPFDPVAAGRQARPPSRTHPSFLPLPEVRHRIDCSRRPASLHAQNQIPTGPGHALKHRSQGTGDVTSSHVAIPVLYQLEKSFFKGPGGGESNPFCPADNAKRPSFDPFVSQLGPQNPTSTVKPFRIYFPT